MDVGDLAHEERADSLGERELDRPSPRKRCDGGLEPLAHQRVAPIEPGDADRQLVELRRLDRMEAGRERLEHRRALGDRSGHGPGMVEGRGEREAAFQRDEAVGRLEADDAAAGGRNPDRAAGVGSEGRVREPGGEGSRRASARAARDPPAGDRVGNGAEVCVLRGDAVGELVEVGLSDVRVAGALQANDDLGAPVWDVIGEEDRPVSRRQAGGVEEVLDRNRDAIRRGRLRPREEDPGRGRGVAQSRAR